jgi:hypothetical protein
VPRKKGTTLSKNYWSTPHNTWKPLSLPQARAFGSALSFSSGWHFDG